MVTTLPDYHGMATLSIPQFHLKYVPIGLTPAPKMIYTALHLHNRIKLLPHQLCR